MVIWYSGWNLLTCRGQTTMKIIFLLSLSVVFAPACSVLHAVFCYLLLLLQHDDVCSSFTWIIWSKAPLIKLGISWKLLTFYCALAALFFLFCFLSAWYSIVFVCLEFNYVLFILLRGIYWATLSNLNGLSSSSHCLAHFCYVSINFNQGNWLWFLLVAYNIHIIIVIFIEVFI